MNSIRFPSELSRILSRLPIVGTLAAIGLLCGVVPEWSKDTATFRFNLSVSAQATVTDEEVTNYARAVLEMEPLRQAAYARIKQIVGSSRVPNIVCGRPESIRSLPPEAQEIARSYCSQSAAIVSKYFPRNRTSRFNTITNLMGENPRLRERIQRELLRLQR
jgi:hypothetical protein